MCGIFGHITVTNQKTRKECLDTLVQGLRRLEYRGYDSAGVCVDSLDGTPCVIRAEGNIDSLEAAVLEHLEEAQDGDSNTLDVVHMGIAHTRWATHGVPSVTNAHPQSSSPAGEFVIVHNGIVSNYSHLKKLLVKHGYVFTSETDTEVIAVLLLHIYSLLKAECGDKNPSFLDVVMAAQAEMEGSFALLIKSFHYKGELIACRRGSPLILGIVKGDMKENKEVAVKAHRNRRNSFSKSLELKDFNLLSASTSPAPADLKLSSFTHGGPMPSSDIDEIVLASDACSIIEHTRRVVYLEDDDVIHVKGGKLSFHSASNGSSASARVVETVETELSQIAKGDYPHFMLKEIFEQPTTVVDAMRGRINFDTKQVFLSGLQPHLRELERARHITFIACGTSYHSALAARPLFEELVQVRASVELASDFLDRQVPVSREDVCFFISQSGETADTLSALSYCKERGALCVGITNTVGSTISRMTSCGMHLNVGPEVGVASTKAYTGQVVALIMVALFITQDSISKAPLRERIVDDLRDLPSHIEKVLCLNPQMLDIAESMKTTSSLLVMARGYHHATCLEAALKIKEVAYIHTEGILAGELKHGPIALIDEDLPVIVVAMRDRFFHSTMNAVNQIAARYGTPIVMASEEEIHNTSDDVVVDENKMEIPSSIPKEKVIRVPHVHDVVQTIVNIIPLQLLSYHLASLRGLNVDRPRNLAKSVTVL